VALIAIIGMIPLYRAAAQSGVVVGLHNMAEASPGGAAQPLLGDLRCLSRWRWRPSPVLFGTRHTDGHRASGRADAGDRH